MDEHGLYTLYVNLRNTSALCASYRENGTNYGSIDLAGVGMPDHQILEQEIDELSSFPEFSKLMAYDWDGERAPIGTEGETFERLRQHQ